MCEIFNMRAIIVLALVGSALAVPMTGNRIVGGSDTTVQQYPFMVNMQFGFFGANFAQSCGGSLITQNAVLSAAHCYANWPSQWWRACLGTSVRSVCASTHVLNGIVIHASYNNPALDNDVAIVRLLNAAVLSQTIQLARVAGPNYILPDGTGITAIGWGHTRYEGQPSEQLQHVVLDIINQQLCADRYAYLKTQPGYERWPDISDSMLCAGILNVGGKDACQGDSGGPVVHSGDIVVGVTSWGFECADNFYPGVLARVSFYSNWIVANS